MGTGQAWSSGKRVGGTAVWFMVVARGSLVPCGCRSSPREGTDLRRREGPRHIEEMNDHMEGSLWRKQRSSSLRSRIISRRVVDCVTKNSDIP